MSREIPPGWYPDNTDPNRDRWWDGQAWTSQVTESAPPPPHGQPPPPILSTQSAGPYVGQHSDAYDDRPWWARKRAIVPAGLLGLFTLIGVAQAVAAPIDEQVATQPDTSAIAPFAATTSSTDSTTLTTAPSVETTLAPSTQPPTTAAPTSAATTAAPPTTPAPLPTEPVATEPQPTEPPPTAAPTTPEAPACHPNYGGCVPIDSDVDCAGGTGNGPSYVQGPVQILGADVYGLDSDNDGIGCE